MIKSVFMVITIALCFLSVSAENEDKTVQPSHPNYGTAFDEVVVESSLNIRPKPADRTTRDVERYLVAPQGRLYRSKRQFNGNFGGFDNNYGSSSALANANSQGQYYGPNGFGASAGNAQGQAFNSQGPLGGFGAAASGAQTQGFNVGPDGFRGSAGLSGSQSYNLPNGHTINLAYSNDFSVGPDGRPNVAKGNSISYTK